MDIIRESSSNGQAISESPRRNQSESSEHGTIAAPNLQVKNGIETALSYTIVDDRSLFTEFINNLRGTLANHHEPEDIHCPDLPTENKRPLLAKLRAEQQRARWIQIELKALKGNKTSSITLVMRDDNVDVIGFKNQMGRWFELGNWRMLPPQYNSVLLGCRVATDKEQVKNMLCSKKLGKKFAVEAVFTLSGFTDTKDVDQLMQPLVGLSVMISDSARMNSVLRAIEEGWGDGKILTNKIMDDVRRYGQMSETLRQWKRRNYPKLHPTSELDAIYLVLNDECNKGDLLSFAYPEMLKVSFPAMFKDMSMATVKVQLRRVNGGCMNSVHGKITALISDEHRPSVGFRVGSMLLPGTEMNGLNSEVIEVPLERTNVIVPFGWVLQIEVDLQIEIPSEDKPKDLNTTLILDKNSSSQIRRPKGAGIEVEVNTTWVPIQESGEQFPPQLSSPVQVVETMSGHRTVVYMIGHDAMTYIEFIIALRRILADHPSREDILDGHKFLNLYSTREHPLLAKFEPRPKRLIHVKLQVEEESGMVYSTTLVMRGDNLYVLGFFNQRGVLYKLLDDKEKSKSDIPEDYQHGSEVEVDWGVSYPRLLKVEAKGYDERCAKIAEELDKIKLHSRFVMDAVRVLSSYPQWPVGDTNNLSPWVALAGLIVIVCESARMNPICSPIAAGWTNGTTFTKKMVIDYLWNWATMSGELRTWKRNDYAESHPISQLQAIYLVFHAKGNGTASGSSGVPPAPGGVVPTTRDEAGGIGSSAAGSSRHVSPSSSQQAGRGGSGSGPGQGAENAGDLQGHGRPLVELLAIRANLEVVGTTITVFDGKRGQIIYKEQEDGKQAGMVELVLTGPYTGISAYGCFAIEIEIPRTASTSSSGGNKHDRTKCEWEWDCDDPMHAAQVDTLQPAQGTISTSDGQKVAEVTYVVMSDAREATVQVRLRLKDGPSRGGIYTGEITARIDGCEHKSVLFRRARGNGQRFSTTNDHSWFLLELARNVVAVPCDRVLHIEVDLQIVTEDGKEVEVKVPLSFDNGICLSNIDDSKEVEVQVTWYPEVRTVFEEYETKVTGTEEYETKVTGYEEYETKTGSVRWSEEYETEAITYTIGDGLSFLSFIMDLRGVAANHRDQREDILDRRNESNLRSTREHPVLPKQRAGQPARWLHVKLEAVQGNETWSTTLAMRDDTLHVLGFRNKQGVWYGLAGDPTKGAPGTRQCLLPYSPQFILDWGGLTGDPYDILEPLLWYPKILKAGTLTEAVEKLAAAHLGRDFAVDSVRRLSSSIPPDQEVDGLMSARLALAGLIFMVCESARMNPVLDSIAGGWSTGTGFTKELVTDYVRKYGAMSRRLLEWKRRDYAEPIPYPELRAVHLVLNEPDRLWPRRFNFDDVED